MKCEACNWQENPDSSSHFVKHVEHCDSCNPEEMVTVWRDGQLMAVKEPLEDDKVIKEIMFKKHESSDKKYQIEEKFSNGDIETVEESI